MSRRMQLVSATDLKKPNENDSELYGVFFCFFVFAFLQ